MEQTSEARKCANCGVEISSGQETWIAAKDKKGMSQPLCPNCVAIMEAAFQAEMEDLNIAGAVAFGLGAALLSSLVWYGLVVLTKYQLGIVAIAVGWLVAQAVMLGAGRKRGPTLQAISVALSLVAMLASEYFIVRYYYYQGVDAPILLSLDEVWWLIVKGIKADPITLLFWGLALWTAYSIPGSQKLRRAG